MRLKCLALTRTKMLLLLPLGVCWACGKMSLLGRVVQHCSRCPRRLQHLQPCQDGQIEPLKPELLLVAFIFEEKAAPPVVSTNQHN